MNVSQMGAVGRMTSVVGLSLGMALVGCDGDGGSATGGAGGTGGEGGTTGSGTGGGGTGGAGGTDQPDVVEIAIRRLNEGQDVAAFEAARDAFVAELKKQPGVGVDREFLAVFDYGVGGPPTPPVYIGMTQYSDLGAFQSAGEALGTSPEAGAFFSTFTPELFTVLLPLDPQDEAELGSLATGEGQVLEVAVRDFKMYSGFDKDDYATKRDAFLSLLAKQEGFVTERQWVSPADADIAVGMTVYASQEAFAAISQDAAFVGSAEAQAFLGTYPPVRGYINISLK
ncbi:MAG: hypothetical protein R3B70_06410 [Polyangiaceae bacterium]